MDAAGGAVTVVFISRRYVTGVAGARLPVKVTIILSLPVVKCDRSALSAGM